MTDWKPLPHSLHSDVRQLIEQLREYKDRSGLSLSSLAERTLHSKSSWERYLNGKALPPQQAVESLGSLVHAEPARLVALWDLADRAWSGRHVSETSPRRPLRAVPAVTPGERVRTPRRRRVFVVTATAVAALTAGVTAMWWNPAGVRPHTSAHPVATASAESGALDTRCFQESCTGKDPKSTGCAGDAWTAAMTRIRGVYVELRYSDSCRAAWARISWGGPGDIAKVVADNGASYQERVHYDTDVYSAMVASGAPSEARACTLLTSGSHDCTKPGGSVHLTEPPPPITSSASTTTP
ncbi:DUF2690 domain-containing protein [Streptomyces sp. NPDC020801]|uniref:helix-turn-helix domain-containing protein n=1 Tax=unclassified Streptomyces TaxID=2593676 RepID=UPI003793C775